MRNYIKNIAVVTLILVLATSALSSCSSRTTLDPDKPVTLKIWHVYGEHSESPMNVLIEEFNTTVGREKGIVIDITSITNSNDVGQNLLDAFNNVPGSDTMPDLFFCHPNNAAAIGEDNLIDWKDYFTKEEQDDYIASFLNEGIISGKLSVFPVAKSTQILFLNDSQFSRFAKDSGHTYLDLASWENFFKVAEDYYKWSGGKAFCALDYPLTLCELQAMSQGKYSRKNGWIDVENPEFKSMWNRLCDAIVKGHIVISDMFSNTQVMTGEVASGIGSSAAILYYNDTVTYPDNSVEPLKLLPLPVPQSKEGTHCVLQAGVGLCALKTTDQKAEAASVFAHWLTDPERNLDFAASTGYLPVTHEAYDKFSDYDFESEAYGQLYNCFIKLRNSCNFVVIHDSSNSYEKTDDVYTQMRRLQGSFHDRYIAGEDEDILLKEFVDSCF